MTSTNATKTIKMNSSVESDSSSDVSVLRPGFTSAPKGVLTSTQAASTNQKRLAHSTIDISSVKKVNQYLARANLSPLASKVDETPLSSTLRQDAASFVPRVNEPLQRPPITNTSRPAQAQFIDKMVM